MRGRKRVQVLCWPCRACLTSQHAPLKGVTTRLSGRSWDSLPRLAGLHIWLAASAQLVLLCHNWLWVINCRILQCRRDADCVSGICQLLPKSKDGVCGEFAGAKDAAEYLSPRQ